MREYSAVFFLSVFEKKVFGEPIIFIERIQKINTKSKVKDRFPTKIRKNFVKLCNFSTFILTVKYEFKKKNLKRLGHQQNLRTVKEL